MRKSHYRDNQILSILKQAEAGTSVPELCRRLGYFVDAGDDFTD